MKISFVCRLFSFSSLVTKLGHRKEASHGVSFVEDTDIVFVLYCQFYFISISSEKEKYGMDGKQKFPFFPKHGNSLSTILLFMASQLNVAKEDGKMEKKGKGCNNG